MQKPQSKQSANFSQHSVVDVDIGVMIMMMEGFNSISQNARIVLVLIMRSCACYSVDRE